MSGARSKEAGNPGVDDWRRRAEGARANGVSVCGVLVVMASFLATPALATDLAVEVLGVEITSTASESESSAVSIEVTWKNGWRDDKNLDAAWIVLRDRSDPVGPPLEVLSASVREVAGAAPGSISRSDDRVGFLVHAAESFRGDARWIVDVSLRSPAPKALSAFGLEMVWIPGGGFEAGDDDADVVADGGFFGSDESGKPHGTYRVDDESAIVVAPAEGALYYEVGNVAQYRGDQSGPIPAGYPKGTRPFWIQKYELLQGQYAAFLDALPADLRLRRSFVAGERDEEAETWSIAETNGRVVASAPRRPCNFVSWDDTAAFLDWMGLRPLTELEYEKAARGPTRPGPRDYPWGLAPPDQVKRRVTKSRDLRHSSSADERGQGSAEDVVLGRSAFGVMDLSGSVWERVVSIGNPVGRAFRGSHGDGMIDRKTGDATNEDWPRGGASGREAEGVGYRGGAEYFKDPSLTNPFSPVASRTYAAWNGAYRYKTYSARGVVILSGQDYSFVAESKQNDDGPRLAIEVTLLANAGVGLSLGDEGPRVLFDAFLLAPYAGYGALGREGMDALIASGNTPLAIATHVHADHLQVPPAISFLRAHPETRFLSTQQSVDALTTAIATSGADSQELLSRLTGWSQRGADESSLTTEGITARGFRLAHSGRFADSIDNLGVLVELGGWRVLHTGDADGMEPNYLPFELPNDEIDVALVPYWYLGSEKGRRIITEHIRPRIAVAVHIPPGQEAMVRKSAEGLGVEVHVLDPGTSKVFGAEDG